VNAPAARRSRPSTRRSWPRSRLPSPGCPSADACDAANPVTGSSFANTLVLAEAGDGSARYEGVVVAGERDEAGAWMLDAPFTGVGAAR